MAASRVHMAHHRGHGLIRSVNVGLLLITGEQSHDPVSLCLPCFIKSEGHPSSSSLCSGLPGGRSEARAAGAARGELRTDGGRERRLAAGVASQRAAV